MNSLDFILWVVGPLGDFWQESNTILRFVLERFLQMQCGKWGGGRDSYRDSWIIK